MDSAMKMNYTPVIESNTAYGYGEYGNSDLNQILENTSFGSFPNNGGMYAFGSGFTTDAMNMTGGMGANFAANTIFPLTPLYPQYDSQPESFPFPRQQVDPATLMNPNGAQGPESPRADSQEQAQAFEDVYVPKPKRTRQSKKKPLTEEQKERKREEFLERNRVAASKCRKRKQEQTYTLQEDHIRLQQEHFILQEAANALQTELTRMRAVLIGHHSSGGCKSPEVLDAQIAQFESATRSDSMYSVRQSPLGTSMSRSNSAVSGISSVWGRRPGYKSDGSPDLMSPHCPESEIQKLNKERLAQGAKDYEAQEMRRHMSNASSSRMTGTSEASGTSEAGGNVGTGYISAITTPEGQIFKEELSLKTDNCRGRPSKIMQNPRSPRQGLVC